MKNKAPKDLIEILTRLSMSMNFESSDSMTKSYIAGYRMALTNVADMYNCYEEYRVAVESEKQKGKSI